MSTETPEVAQKLYATREPVFPKRVKGKFRQLKWWLMIFTLGVYYITPWIRWDRGPNMPDQAVLIDMAGRRFFMFWIEIWPHEFYFVAGLLIMAGLGLFLFTSALGRVWCGYACPQTVWVDLYVQVERWVEGDRNARIRLLNAKWDARKWRLRLTKWSAWLLIAVATGGAWVFYFADAPTLLVELLTGQAAFVAYAFIASLTATTFIFGGFMQEQICTYMCPWPRIQAAMMDEDTMTVSYRDWRGEPRAKLKESTADPSLGDCIDCNACVAVCPVGIDIREGQQLECITCALCIDACDEMMVKVGRPTGLIAYLTANDEPLERAGHPPRNLWKHLIRFRTIMYATLWAAVGVGLLVALFVRPDIEVNVSPIRNPVFVALSDGTIRNDYDLRILNKHGEERPFHITITSAATDADIGVQLQGIEGVIVLAPADDTYSQRVYLVAGPGDPAGSRNRTEVRIWIEDMTSGDRAFVDTIFNGKAP
ncbi:cytochrome c oxidase accessory protein CcoG [Rhodobacterales bacterium 52_120_T64]|nr:cytochrome c oxidase accessory protein CcoG [Rhodobacterales bacterium 52_120_T64]